MPTAFSEQSISIKPIIKFSMYRRCYEALWIGIAGVGAYDCRNHRSPTATNIYYYCVFEYQPSTTWKFF